MVNVPKGDRILEKYGYLLALKLGEFEEFPIKPTAAEKRLRTQRSMREAYMHITRICNTLNASQSRVRLAQRIGDWDNRKTVDTVRIYCARIGDEAFQVPSTKGGFRQVVIAHEKKLEAAAALPTQIEQAREASKPQPHDPPHIHKVTRDETLRLVELVAAHTRGEIIQVCNGGGVWHTTPMPDWTLPVARLRIAPPPRRELWVTYSRDGTVHHVGNSKPAHVDPSCLVHYREVLPEDDD